MIPTIQPVNAGYRQSNDSIPMHTTHANSNSSNSADSDEEEHIGQLLFPESHNLNTRIKLFFPDDDEDNHNLSAEELEQNALRSLSHDQACQLHFENTSATTPLYLYWIQFNGDIAKPPHTLTPLTSLRLKSYTTHPFIITTSETLNAFTYNTILAVYIANHTKQSDIHLISVDAETDINVSPFDPQQQEEEDDNLTITTNNTDKQRQQTLTQDTKHITMHCKCGATLSQTAFHYDDTITETKQEEEDILFVCFGCDSELETGDPVWICKQPIHNLKIYCADCSQRLSRQPMAFIQTNKSDLDSDYCCNHGRSAQRHKRYPRMFPATFSAHMVLETVLRVISLASDVLLFVAIVLFPHILDSKNDTFDSFPEENENDVWILRTVLTFLPGAVLVLALLAVYQVHKRTHVSAHAWNEDSEISSQNKKTCFVHFVYESMAVLTVFLLVTLTYKLLMFALALFRLFLILSRKSSSSSRNSESSSKKKKKKKKSKTNESSITELSSDIELKHILLLYPLLVDQILSGWPLLILALDHLIESPLPERAQDGKAFLAFFAVSAKVLCSGLLLFLEVDRLRLWRLHVRDPKAFVPVCLLHATRVYAMRAREVAKSAKSGKVRDVCGMCREPLSDEENAMVWECGHAECFGNVVCLNCCFGVLGKYQEEVMLDDESFYRRLLDSNALRDVYEEQISAFGSMKGFEENGKASGNKGRKVLWFKVVYNMFLLLVLSVGVLVFQEVWLGEYADSVVGDVEDVEDWKTTTVYGCLLLVVAMLFEVVLVVFQVVLLCGCCKVEMVEPRIVCNIMFVFYLLGFSLLLFEFEKISDLHFGVQAGLVGFCAHVVMLPMIAGWQIISAKLYLWEGV